MTPSTGILDRLVSSNANLTRLKAAMLDAHRRLADYGARGNAKQEVVIAARLCLARAQEEFDRQSWYIAWDCLHQFDDEMLRSLEEVELSAYWCVLRAEAKAKLGGSWRGEAADALVAKVADGKPVQLEVVRGVQQLLTVSAQNKQHKIEVYQRATLPTVATLLVFVVAAALLAAYIDYAADSTAEKLSWLRSTVLAITAGALGGILSLTYSLGRTDFDKKIPEMRLGALMTLTRPFLGAAVAIPVLVLVKEKYIQVSGFTTETAIFTFCFLAGFSERWFLGLMERFESEKGGTKKK